jgi:sugar phosphate isomerase/epimerase
MDVLNKNFMIGQYGGFDEAKYRRDFREGFYGIEACSFTNEGDAARLLEESRSRGFRIGVHFPMRAGRANLRDAMFLAADDLIRGEAYALIRGELDYLAHIRPDYVLFHYPKPVILDDRVDWSGWRFADSNEYVRESEYPFQVFVEKSEALFRWLSEKSREYAFTPVLEFDALNSYIYANDVLEQLLNKYSAIKLCLDTGRLYMQDRLDPRFDSRAVIRRYAKYAKTIHLWTLQANADGRIERSRYPVLPHLRPDDGWAPIEEYLHIIQQENPHAAIMFEHRSELVSDEELQECYRWVDSIMQGAGPEPVHPQS